MKRLRATRGGSTNRFAVRERKQHKNQELGDREGIGTVKSIYHLCSLVRQKAYDIHVYHGHGHLEKVYENALANRLRKAGVHVQQQCPITVFDEDGTTVGEYFADLIIESQLLVELKATSRIAEEHVAQILGYLKSTHMEHGLLINFGSYKFEIKKYVFSHGNLPQK